MTMNGHDIGFAVWGTAAFIFQEEEIPGKGVFSMTVMVIGGYVFGHSLQRMTTINAVAGMVLVGAMYRHFGPTNFLLNKNVDIFDYHLRRVYPVLILGRGALSWSWEYIKDNSVKVFTLATIPWIVECVAINFFTYILLDYPWYWGLQLGSILASVSPVIVVPTVRSFSARGLGVKHQIADLVANAAGLDTAFTEGMSGVITSAVFFESIIYVRVFKAVSAIFIGIGFGVGLGVVADYLPEHTDNYAPSIRTVFIISFGMLMSYAGGFLGWGGVAGVAIMVGTATASNRWARHGWKINANPVSKAFNLLWRIFEPMLFTLSGYYLDITLLTPKQFCLILVCLFCALFLRLLTAFLVCLANGLTLRESLFVAITWIPKAVVESVCVRIALDNLGTWSTMRDVMIAKQSSDIIVIAVLCMTTLGSVLTTVLGPVLLSPDSRVAPDEFYRNQALSPPPPADDKRINPNPLPHIDTQQNNATL